MNINEFQPTSGRFIKEDGTTVNIADALNGKSVSDKVYDIDNMMPHSGRFIKEDGTCANIADMIANGDISGGGGSDSGSFDDAAPPIVETYNGQVIQSFMSADRPLKGLNLYATCKQDSTEGKNLCNPDEIEVGGLNIDTGEPTDVTNIMRTGYIPVKVGKRYKYSGTDGFYFYSRAFVYQSDKTMIAGFSQENSIPEGGAYVRLAFSLTSSADITESDIATFASRFMFAEGTSELPYEPYTGGIPSPNGDYPQEIQTISDFVVEVKNSMGEVATPQTLNVTIPEQGFYGIPVGRTIEGDYTDTGGQRWICDEIDYKNKKIIKRVGKKAFNGSESWNITNSNMDGLKEFSTPLENAADTDSDKIVLCNRGKNVGAGWLYAEDNTCYIKNGLFRYCKSGADVNTNKKFKTWLATHNIEIIYSLDEPIEYDLTNEQVEQFKKLKSYYGTTYIDNDAVPACNMTADIVVDTKMYIDSKLSS